jgi:dimethylamine/trimethylamine dehydrogenase
LDVTIAEQTGDWGGRVLSESRLPGMATWRRVRDYRVWVLSQMGNVAMFTNSELDVQAALDFGSDHIAIATGARWTRRRYSALELPAEPLITPQVYTPEDVYTHQVAGDRLLVFDFDNYYLGGVIAEHLAEQGHQVTYATPAGHASAWTFMTNELPFVYRALAARNVAIHTSTNLMDFDGQRAMLQNLFNAVPTELDVDGIVIVGHREPRDELYQTLSAALPDNEPPSLHLLGDALAPGAIVHAVHSGHGYARSLVEEESGYLRDEPIILAEPQRVFPS